LYKKYGKLDFILDDESYFTLSHTAQSGNNIFYSSNLNLTPKSVSSNYRSKYEPKLLVYILISPRGMCKPYFRPSGLAVNQDVYLEECIKKRVVPFIRKNYRPGQYAHTVQDYLKTNHITYVPKWCNPANVPKARPIEDFWGNLKENVYKGDWRAKDLDSLKKNSVMPEKNGPKRGTETCCERQEKT
jgi:hypothetical protein